MRLMPPDFKVRFRNAQPQVEINLNLQLFQPGMTSTTVTTS